MLRSLPLVERPYFDELVRLVFVQLIPSVDDNFVEEVGYLWFVSFVGESSVEIGDDVGRDTRGFVHQPIEVVSVEL
jgi:hypothetical protein